MHVSAQHSIKRQLEKELQMRLKMLVDGSRWELQMMVKMLVDGSRWRGKMMVWAPTILSCALGQSAYGIAASHEDRRKVPMIR